jgi:hypothetical protein
VGVGGMGDGPKAPIPNPQSPIPNPQSPLFDFKRLIFLSYKIINNIKIINNKYK